MFAPLRLDQQDEKSIITYVEQIIHLALSQRASDIHFEPYQHSYRIRMRVDGLLLLIATPPIALARQLAARLKILAQLNITEQRLPQDGQMTVQYQQQQYALRISTLPVYAGEKIVLRIMERAPISLDLAELGFSETAKLTYQQALDSPQGLILVTGPTGSGKSITLYSGLARLNQIERNICSIEDPIEIPLSGINQSQVNLKAGLTFAKALRAFLRQDPDIMMIGEIRDAETALIAVQAAQTGHLVLSTLHTNSSLETLIRLKQMSIDSYLLATSLKLIIAQRLVRRLCPYCKKLSPHPWIIDNEAIDHYQAIGCQHCIEGYYQRTGLYEILPITPYLQQQLLKQATLTYPQLQCDAQLKNFKTLKQAGLTLIKQGITSVTELQRVINPD